MALMNFQTVIVKVLVWISVRWFRPIYLMLLGIYSPRYNRKLVLTERTGGWRISTSCGSFDQNLSKFLATKDRTEYGRGVSPRC